MRHIVLALAFCSLSPVAFAQSNPPGHGSTPAPALTAPGTSMSAAQPMAGPSGQDNCGTPDEPKACPPMPRHAMKYYPSNK